MLRRLMFFALCITTSLLSMHDEFGNPVELIQDHTGLVYPVAHIYHPVFVPGPYPVNAPMVYEPSLYAPIEYQLVSVGIADDDNQIENLTDSLQEMSLGDDSEEVPVHTRPRAQSLPAMPLLTPSFMRDDSSDSEQEQLVSSASPATQTIDDRLLHAFSSLGTASNAVDRIRGLMHNKVNWINNRMNNQVRKNELQKLYDYFQSMPESVEDVDRVYLAETLIATAEQIGHKNDRGLRKKFARLGKGYLNCVNRSHQLPLRLTKKMSTISERVDALLPQPKVLDKTHISENQFYALLALQEQEEAYSHEQHAHTQKERDDDSSVQSKEIKTKKKATENLPQNSAIEKQIVHLLKGSSKDVRKGLLLLDQVALEKIPVEDNEYKIYAARTLGGYYLRGCADASNPTVMLIKQNRNRAMQCLQKAIEFGSAAALADSMSVYLDEKNYDEMEKCAEQLLVHENSTSVLKQLAHVYKGIRIFCESQEEGKGDVLFHFKKVINQYHCTESMQEIADCLPRNFYEQVYEHIDEWHKDIDEDKAAMLYFMGRLSLQGKANLFESHKYNAVTWIKAAAKQGNVGAQIYLSVSDETGIPVAQRINYLEIALDHLGDATESEQKDVLRLCDYYASQGFLRSMYRVLDTIHTIESIPESLKDNTLTLPEVLKKFESEFPSLVFGLHEGHLYSLAQESGLRDALETHVQSSWAARAILSALEITYVRDNYISDEVMLNDNQAIAMMEQAIDRIKKDVSVHAQLEPLMYAAHSTHANAIGFSLVKEQEEKEKKIKEMVNKFEYAAKHNDIFAHYTYAQILLSDQPMLQKYHSEKRGLRLLNGLIEGDNPYKYHALRDLIIHYVDLGKLDQAQHYLDYAKRQYTNEHRTEYANEWVREMECYIQKQTAVQSNKNKKYKKKRARDYCLNSATQLVAARTQKMSNQVQTEQVSAIAAVVETLKYDASKLSKAYGLSDEKPFQALKLATDVLKGDLGLMLPKNPHLIVQCYMMLDSLVASAADEAIVDPRLKEPLLKKLYDFEIEIIKATDEHEQMLLALDYEPTELEKISTQYLRAQNSVSVLNKIQRISDPNKQLEQVHAILDKMPQSDTLKNMTALCPPEDLLRLVMQAADKHLAIEYQRYVEEFKKNKPSINVDLAMIKTD